MSLNWNQWWWYVYQYHLTILLEFAVRQSLFHHYSSASSTFDTASKKIVEDLIKFNRMFFFSADSSVDTSFDLLLEWHWNCFQDINYIFNIWSDTFCIFIQSKWSKRQDNTKFRTKFIDIVLKFADNINISRINYSLTVVHNRITPPWAQGFKRLSKSQTDNHHLVDLTISLLKKQEWVVKKNITKLLYKKQEDESFLRSILLEYYKTNKVNKLDQISDPVIIKYIELYKSILENTFLLDNFQYPHMCSIITNYINSWLLVNSLAELYHKYSILSTDSSPIYATDPKFAKYLSYDNIYFSSESWGKRPSTLPFISEWKFVD